MFCRQGDHLFFLSMLTALNLENIFIYTENHGCFTRRVKEGEVYFSVLLRVSSLLPLCNKLHFILFFQKTKLVFLQHMSLQFSSLNSGSNGNCYYVGNNTDAVLVDAGISCKEIENRMQTSGLNMQKVKAIFISHEHGDHIKGLCSLAHKYALPVYGSIYTLQSCPGLDPLQKVHIAANTSVTIGTLTIKAFRKFHDAADPQSFTVSNDGQTVGVFTDIGRPCINLTNHFSQCHAIFLEANYDDALLENGRYPYFLKNRIRGGNGHLSNQQALDVFLQHRTEKLQYLLLSHLSKDNNCPELVKDLFEKQAGQVRIIVASRYEASAVYTLGAVAEAKMLLRKKLLVTQLSIFENL